MNVKNFNCFVVFSSVQFSHSVLSDSATPWTAARQAHLSITNSQSLSKLMSIESVMPSNHLILCFPLLLLPSIFPIFREQKQWLKTTKIHFFPKPNDNFGSIVDSALFNHSGTQVDREASFQAFTSPLCQRE